jgi:hypothetical protein
MIDLFYMIRGGANMSLFKNEKTPCLICGNPTPKIYPTMIEDQPICRECEKLISMEDHLMALLTINRLRAHLKYREKNSNMHAGFVETRKASCEMRNRTICIDDVHRLWYIKDKVNEPIFRFVDLMGFTLLEDSHILQRGNAKGIETFPSIVESEELDDLIHPAQKLNGLLMCKSYKDKASINNSYEQKIKGLVKTIRLEIEVNNIYWQKLKLNFNAPDVIDHDINRFIIDYRSKLAEIQEIAQSLMTLFPKELVNNMSYADELMKIQQLYGAEDEYLQTNSF